MILTAVFIKVLASVLVCLSALLSVPMLFQLRQPVSPVWWGLKVLAPALAPILSIAGISGLLLGILAGTVWISMLGGYTALVFLIFLYRVKSSLKAPTGFPQAFGPDWAKRIPANQRIHFLPTAIGFGLPKSGNYQLTQDIPFSTVPGTNRELLCDIWQPSEQVQPSGLAFLYFHGSAWCVLDKDVGTRPFFKHLVAQGHVVMDVAYRLFPETDMTGMVHDVFRAIAWMKNNAAVYGVDPGRIVLGGGSAGGHLALLAAYSGNDPQLVPETLQHKYLSVRAVLSLYGPTDLEALYFHTAQDITTRKSPEKAPKARPAQAPAWVQKMMGKNFHRLGMDKDGSEIGVLPVILGCHPDECPEIYAAFSPISHVHQSCPPTLLLQGQHDLITPVQATRHLYDRLTALDVPVVMFNIPQTDHAFDLMFPKISPVAHTAYYVVERFLALQV